MNILVSTEIEHKQGLFFIKGPSTGHASKDYLASIL
jgi:hypothetical protein